MSEPSEQPTAQSAGPPPAEASQSGQARPVPAATPGYTLIRSIGRGSYGEVWLARNLTGSYRAVKIVYRSSFEAERPYEREFQGIQEFEPISRAHPGQVAILHVGRNDELGYFYYVMELADDVALPPAQVGRRAEEAKCGLGNREPRTSSATAGQRIDPGSYEPATLRTLMRTQPRLPVDRCLEIASRLTDALQHLHAHGLVHRDIKPSNIIFVNGLPKLADIGLVARVDATFSFVGTEGYLPPEGPGKPQADIYSLGKVLYEMATGKDRNRFPEPPTLLRELPDVGAFQELNEVILRACAPDARERYLSAAQMQADLAALRAGKSLKRSRLVEGRLALLSKLSVAGVVLTVLILAGYLYQQDQTAVARELLRQNRLQVARLQEMNGLRLLEEGDLIGALPWFSEALGAAQGDAETERRHRLRIGMILRQCPHLVQSLREPGSILGAEFRANGHRIVTTGVVRDGQPGLGRQFISLWNLTEGTLIRRIDTGLIRRVDTAQMSASPDGDRVIAWFNHIQWPGAEGQSEKTRALVFDLRTGGLAGSPLSHDKFLSQAVFSPDGLQVMTASLDGVVRLWNPESAECVRQFRCPAAVLTAAFDPAGATILAACKNGTAFLFEARSGRELTRLDLASSAPGQSFLRIEFSPDGRRAVIASHQEAQLWEVGRAAKLGSFRADGSGFENLRFSPDGERILVAEGNGRVHLWKAAAGEPVVLSLANDLGGNNSAVFSPDGQLVISGGTGLAATIWDVNTGLNVWPPLPRNFPLAEHGNGVRFSADGRMVLAASGASLQVWDLTRSPSATMPSPHRGAVTSVECDPTGEWLVTASDDGTAQVRDARTGHPISPPLRHAGPVVRAEFVSEGRRVLTTSGDGTARLWDAETAEPAIPPLRHGAAVNHAELSRDGQWILTVGDDRRVRLWSAASGEAAGQPIDPGSPFRVLGRFSPDSRRVITASGADLKAWEVPSGEQLHWAPPFAHTSYWDLQFSPGGEDVVLSMATAGAQVFEAQSFDPVTPPLTHSGKHVIQAGWRPDGKAVVTTSLDDPTARLWDAATGRRLAAALKHAQPARWPAFNPDGRLVLTASQRQGPTELDTVYLWDAGAGALVAPPLRHPARICPPVFSPDAARVITGDQNGTIHSWDLSPYQGSLEELRAITQVLSGQEITGTTILEPVDEERLQATFEQSRATSAPFSPSSTNEWILFHRREAEDATRAGRAFSERWHLDQLKALVGETPASPR